MTARRDEALSASRSRSSCRSLAARFFFTFASACAISAFKLASRLWSARSRMSSAAVRAFTDCWACSSFRSSSRTLS